MRIRLSLPPEFDWLKSLSGRARTRLFVSLLKQKDRHELLTLAQGEVLPSVTSGQTIEQQDDEEQVEIVEIVTKVDPSILSNFC
ncbi:hypothetical protein KFV02_03985 [Desulfohalobiaceae bacterium Ax17]|uniref:hypothetical protein n=1 Tax=Desulfovulcanus ferrireducens TaxID=2831190 RepID=UPI00207BB3F3|nr:hypothetical protein [Desulfovulcanus ferrireducens]MBT8763086.1 hypothetical protein [Desulfovulcanus ferrireducens]